MAFVMFDMAITGDKLYTASGQDCTFKKAKHRIIDCSNLTFSCSLDAITKKMQVMRIADLTMRENIIK